MGVKVDFNYTTWAALFPDFSNLNSGQVIDLVLPIAEVYQRNDGFGPASTAAQQSALLNMMVAHVAQLMFGSATVPANPVVGRISSATEGSVTVAAEWPGADANSAFFLQTKYGAMWWQATAPYRTMRYIPRSNRRVFNPWPNQ